MAWQEINPTLMAEINASDRAPLAVPPTATHTGERSRWQEVMTIVDTQYEEKVDEKSSDMIGIVKIRFRVSDQYSTDPTNRGKVLTANKRVNFTQLASRANDGQYQMSTISLRQLSSLLMASKAITSRDQMTSLGEWFANNAKLAGSTVIAQIEHGPNRQGEPQQEPTRFAPFGG